MRGALAGKRRLAAAAQLALEIKEHAKLLTKPITALTTQLRYLVTHSDRAKLQTRRWKSRLELTNATFRYLAEMVSGKSL